MDYFEFVVPGRVGGKGRPRFSRKGGFAYTPAKTRSTEAMVREIAHNAMRGRAPFEGPLAIDVTVTLNTPASWPKKRKAAAFYVTGKPDCDNVVKLIGDALNGIVWADDSQLCDVHIRRRYNDAAGESVAIAVYVPGKGSEFRSVCPRCDQYVAQGSAHDCQPLHAVAA